MKVISVTPAGRKRYLEILIPYLLREKKKGTINKHIFWINTNVKENVEYIKKIVEADSFFEFREINLNRYGNLTICNFFKECIDENALYIRFDDDVCWMHEDSVENLINARLNDKEAFLVYGNIINNSICSHLHQRMGIIPTIYGMALYHVTNPLGWSNGKFSELVHKTFIKNIKNPEKYFMNDWRLFPHLTGLRERFSINVISWFGSVFYKFKGIVGKSEEEWLSVTKPHELKTYNVISGNSLFTHFAYYPQRPYLEEKTNLLQQYKEIALKIDCM